LGCGIESSERDVELVMHLVKLVQAALEALYGARSFITG
jgi:hypothetical protein